MLAMQPSLSKQTGVAGKQEYDVLTVSQSKLKLIIDELERVRFPDDVTETEPSHSLSYFKGIKRIFGY